MIFFYCLLLYSIFSISFSQEEPIHDFLHLLRIRSLRSNQKSLNIFLHKVWMWNSKEQLLDINMPRSRTLSEGFMISIFNNNNNNKIFL